MPYTTRPSGQALSGERQLAVSALHHTAIRAGQSELESTKNYSQHKPQTWLVMTMLTVLPAQLPLYLGSHDKALSVYCHRAQEPP